MGHELHINDFKWSFFMWFSNSFWVSKPSSQSAHLIFLVIFFLKFLFWKFLSTLDLSLIVSFDGWHLALEWALFIWFFKIVVSETHFLSTLTLDFWDKSKLSFSDLWFFANIKNLRMSVFSCRKRYWAWIAPV